MVEMNDREMLELAAKAAGITLKHIEVKNVEFIGDNRFIGFMTDPAQWQRGWFDPIKDDGDALRLAIKLNMGISIPVMMNPMVDVITFRNSSINVREECSDILSATRRAIVRAAAEIGRQI